MKKIIIYILIISPIITFAQDNKAKETRREKLAKSDAMVKKMQTESEEGAIIFNKQSAFNITIRNDGYAIGFEKGKFKSIKKTNLWWVHLGERKHPKEEKITLNVGGVQLGNPFIFGKKNNFYLLNIGIGQQRLLGGKSNKNGISVAAVYGGGLSLGLLKPYYLEVFSDTSNNNDIIKYSLEDQRFLNPGYIVGAAPFGKGFNELKLVPGAFVKGGFRFDYGKLKDVAAALELGVSAEYYTQKVPTLWGQKEKTLFISGYVSLIFGNRR